MSKKLFDEEIVMISKVMQDRLIEKQEKHGDEWKISGIHRLRWRILFLYNLFLKSIDIEDEKKTLVDLANQCMLLYLRLEKNE